MVSFQVKKPQVFYSGDGLGDGVIGKNLPLQSNAILKTVLTWQQEHELKSVLQSNISAVSCDGRAGLEKRVAEIEKLGAFLKSLVSDEQKKELGALGAIAKTTAHAEGYFAIITAPPEAKASFYVSQDNKVVFQKDIIFISSETHRHGATVKINSWINGEFVPETYELPNLQLGDDVFLRLKSICSESMNFQPAGKQG